MSATWVVALFSYAVMSAWLDARRLRPLKARLAALEEREASINEAIARVNVATRQVEYNTLEISQILPPLRAALATFKKFNETY